jgi:CAAX protease family protein
MVFGGPSFSPRGIVAPWWHTTLLIVFFVCLALFGGALQRGAHGQDQLLGHRPQVAILYLSLVAGEWCLVYYVWRGLRRRGIPLSQLIGGQWTSVRAIVLDCILALGTWLLLEGVSWCWARWVGSGNAASTSMLAPHNLVETMFWVMLSISAGFSEELVFRGYLQRQLSAFTGSTWLALVLQASIFGIAHGYQGIRNCLFVALYGATLTMLALWRKSLRPGMMAHAWTDIVGGFLH